MHFGKSHLEDKREDLRSHYGKIEKTAGVTALRIAFCHGATFFDVGNIWFMGL